ncbi:hypothetical protein MJO28_007554 [Puccinia striiformis f. sp. tritici]|uniref:alpha-galactosidase n=2 Tax=Puccinia striiformis f. sp. tritici TaxID=168172 RepID=A0A0L0VS82_9BASI|nr:hypothetical protein Pst134EB_014628 [Puccinia striiformis f. sp. tritici]KAI7951870.1 hypothetical protein MJO28_007554 [Puccinia striiformis f. sp. tritici]KAI7956099.1 hypothetical protein MJO29_007498 [Puccinia striiformis f. sp. tritici]KAI9604047.1 hypothetical protein H4Q26_003657 [Puccinia striiformis f. sp. tritici PST-130]KNF02138.1 hypothetical protein PSTG_04636 [Puccinia striiformis f. sp. tritici PST-78]
MLKTIQRSSLVILLIAIINHQAHATAKAPIQPPTKPHPVAPDQGPVTDNQVSGTYFGWSTWSLQAYKGKGYGYGWVTEVNIKATADILSTEFSQLGYTRINLDSGWQDEKLDKFGRTVLNHTTYPSGIEHLSGYLAQKKLKLGLYYLPGIDARAVNSKAVVMNTKYTADQIIQCPDKEALNCNRNTVNAFNAGMALNYSHPGAQMYINSVVEGLYSWGVSFVKLDGIVPGSSVEAPEYWKYNTTADLMAWRKAINELYEQKWKKQGRERIWLGASWKIPPSAGSTMDKYMNSFRIEQDIEAYSETQMTTFDRVIRNAKTAALWSSVEANRKWKGVRDLDSILISDMTIPECKTLVTIWAIFGSIFYLGDDLTKLPEARKALVKNPEVLKVAAIASANQARFDGFDPSVPPAQASNLQSSNRLQTRDGKGTHQTPTQQCQQLSEKRRMVVEQGLYQKVDDSDDYLKSCLKARKNENLFASQLQSVGGTEGAKPDQWSLQTWVLEQGQGDIYVAVVNAGQQTATDQPAKVQISLGKLKTLQKSPKMKEMIGMQYTVRDLWNRKDLSNVPFQGQIDLALEIHGSALLKFSPIRPIPN